uniref:FAS1 domain-containing protein n=1 Tax=Ascaris lumbricoides TaxID=6252 RepID=A0A0M3I485_ASCLU
MKSAQISSVLQVFPAVSFNVLNAQRVVETPSKDVHALNPFMTQSRQLTPTHTFSVTDPFSDGNTTVLYTDEVVLLHSCVVVALCCNIVM